MDGFDFYIRTKNDLIQAINEYGFSAMQNHNARSVYISCRTFRTADWLFFYVPRSTDRLSVSDSSDKHTVFSAFLAWGTPPVFGHRKSLRRISPTKAVFILFSYCNYSTLLFDSQWDNVGHLRTFTDIFKIFLPERLELAPKRKK